MSVENCPLCASRESVAIMSADAMPVFANVLFDSRDDATSAATGHMELVGCARCGLLYNSSVDPELLAYSPAYENSLHHSPVFESYATALAERLVETYDLVDRDVVEIGPGNGDFLTMLVRAGVRNGIGFDPSHNPETAVLAPGVSIRSEYYPEALPAGAGAVASRHVVEHLESPRVLLDAIRTSLEVGDGAVVYLEVPDATYMVTEVALWDVIYEHLTYASEPTLNWACESAGLHVVASGRSFGDQYLWNESVAAGVVVDLDPPDPSEFLAAAVEFGAEVGRRIDMWSTRIEELAVDGPLAVWGAGSKGTSFLSMVPAATAVEMVVDVNPAKKGRYVPVSGHRISAPEELLGSDVAHVIVMNPIYIDEIAGQLRDLGLDVGVHSM